jgi:hypothetical protein
MFDRSPPSAAEIEKWFLTNPDLPPRTFEFALVLGGTVSAGAYTAGALDFLIEALDSWTEAREAGDPAAPRHNTVLRVVTGTSGGGVCAAIAGRALAFEFDPIARGTPVGAGLTGNPLYDTWVKTLTLDRFLDTGDIGKDVVSLLNGAAIDAGARNIVDFVGRGPKRRSWIAAPLRVILTLTNLRGIPFRLEFDSGRGESYVDHADYIRYALVYPNQSVAEFRPDELALGFDGQRLPQAGSWDEFSLFARATAAFPAGFPPRAVVRPTAHYRYHVVLRAPLDPAAALTAEPSYAVLTPDWDALAAGGGDVPDDYHFLTVDGGATNNEPIELARTALCGVNGSNPRDPREANRAVLLIDPFAGRTALGPEGMTSFAHILGAIGNAVIQQTRYDSRDLVLAADERVFSRFMLTPQLGSKLGEQAIASAGFGAFIGFACQDFMRYDYLLGRKNCQDFLRSEFVLAGDNRLFDAWTDDQRAAFRVPGGNFLPIIPLFGQAAVDETLDPWPKGKLDPERYRAAIEKRFRTIFETELSGGPLRALLGWIAAHAAQGSFTDYVIGTMKQYLKDAGLA